MVYRRILEWPDKSLRKKSDASNLESDAHVYKDLADTFLVSGGYGLSAPQIGHHVRVIIINESLLTEDESLPSSTLMINPELVSRESRKKFREACFSLPGHDFEVERFNSINVQFLDKDGNKKEKSFEGYGAACIQHEIDHLDGKLAIDHLSQLRKSMWVKKVKKNNLRIKRRKENERIRNTRSHKA